MPSDADTIIVLSGEKATEKTVPQWALVIWLLSSSVAPDGLTACSWAVILLRHHVCTLSCPYSRTVFSNCSHSDSTWGRKLTASQIWIAPLWLWIAPLWLPETMALPQGANCRDSKLGPSPLSNLETSLRLSASQTWIVFPELDTMVLPSTGLKATEEALTSSFVALSTSMSAVLYFLRNAPVTVFFKKFDSMRPKPSIVTSPK